MDDSSKSKKNIRGAEIIYLLIWAAFADALTLIPLAGDIVGPAFWIILAIYFAVTGRGFMNVGRLTTGAVSIIAEMIPAIQALPTIVLGTMVVVALFRFEAKTGIKVTGGITKKGTEKRLAAIRENRDKIKRGVIAIQKFAGIKREEGESGQKGTDKLNPTQLSNINNKPASSLSNQNIPPVLGNKK